MKPNQTDSKAVARILEPDLAKLTKEQQAEVMAVALAATEAAFEAYEAKAKFMVLGQVRYNGEYLSPEDFRAAKVALGPFGTRKQAESAGESLAYNSKTGEESRWAAVAVWNGTPAAWYASRLKERQQALQATSTDTPARELRHQHIRDWLDAHPGETVLPEHLQGNGWEGLDRFMQWRSDHLWQCSACEGTGKIKRQE